jgi:RNA polymerase sigma factor (sigma-70 family)
VELEGDVSRDERAEFERLYVSHAAAVRRHLAYLTGDASLAEDLAQEAFGRLYAIAANDGLAGVRNPRAWLLTVASNLAYNHFRSQTRRETRGEPPEASAENSIDVDTVIDVRRALAALDVRDRLVLMLRHSGFSYAEIAEAIDVSPTSMGTILARAQRRFRTAYVGASGAEKE